MLPCNCLIRFSCYLYVNKGWTGSIRPNGLSFSSQAVIFGAESVEARSLRDRPRVGGPHLGGGAAVE